MSIYINGIGLISPQKTFEENYFLSEYIHSQNNTLKSCDPDFNLFVDPRIGRRMSRILKQGIVASSICLKESETTNPDAIITGTGLGIVEDTEKFLISLLDNEEKFLNPTPFIQSTHNTIGSYIAQMLKCHGYNHTYVQRGFSFESTLIDAQLLIENGDASNVLVGGFDEITDDYVKIRHKVDYWKKREINSLDLLNDTNTGTIAGEGVGFFNLSTIKDKHTYARLNNVKTVFNPDLNNSYLADQLELFLKACNIDINQISTVILGRNGDPQFDKFYFDLQNGILSSANQCHFKHLTGDYHTSSVFALWLGANIMKRQQIPEITRLNTLKKEDQEIQNVLILNNWRGVYHSFILLTQ